MRHVLAVMQHVDSVLATIERLVDSTASPFVREADDLTTEERESIHTLVARLREKMSEALERIGAPATPKDMSARWSIEAGLRAADVSFSDLGGPRLGGYGKLDPGAAELVARLAAELRHVVEEGILMIRQSPRSLE